MMAVSCNAMIVEDAGFDWGQRSDRWAGVRSDVVDVQGRPTHVLRADADPTAPGDAPTHVLIHAMGAGSWAWLDAMRPLAAFGPIIAVDLPGSSRVPPPHRGSEGVDASALFIVDLIERLGLERVVLHGHSFGGIVALHVANLAGDQVKGLVLVAPPLAAAPDSWAQQLAWRTIGRYAFFVAPLIVRMSARLSVRRKAAAWRRWREDPAGTKLREGIGRIGGDPSRISPELYAILLDEIDGFRTIPWRLDSGVIAMTSAVRAMTLEQPAMGLAIDRVVAPTLILWGDEDRVIPRVMIDDLLARRPDWQSHVVEGAGHLMPWELPDVYATVVGRWLTNR
jgi:pimeloyl-ACP methyl ester carboxylesterase